MKHQSFMNAWRLGLAVLTMAVCAERAGACCGVSPSGESVGFAQQENLIVWDAKKGIEHFVRHASFNTQAKSFGFIAPTPSVPELEEADSKLFGYLRSLTPKTRVSTFGTKGGDTVASMPSLSAPVVVQTKDVAGYRATTLKANDAEGLAKWMLKNGYHTSSDVAEWTRFYIRKGWYLTAFKVNGDGLGNGETGCIRMSFETDRPFNPYLVPSSNIRENGGRFGLRVYFASADRYEPNAHLGRPRWTVQLADSNSERIAELCKLENAPKEMFLAMYHDALFPNPEARDDVYFDPVRTESRLGSASMLASIAIVSVLGGLWVWRRHR